jgi:CheY-like chemotaxis protein/HPt (histidine-containing phosphotransfer) domain-containing protein
MGIDPAISKSGKAESSGNVYNGKSILIVDDNEINQKLLRAYLLAMGFQVFTSKDGYSALNVLGKHPIDLIFLDLHMPVMNGYETTKAIRQLDGRHSQVPIIGLSADGLPKSQQQAIQSGMNEYLVKPIKQDDLQQILGRWFQIPQNGEPAQLPPNVISRTDDLRRMLMKEMPDYKLRLLAALDKHDYAEIYQIVHRLAGGSAYCELPELYRISNLLQAAAKRQNAAQIELYSSGLLEQINHLLKDIPAVSHN